jgi:hypothetical protein
MQAVHLSPAENCRFLAFEQVNSFFLRNLSFFGELEPMADMVEHAR